MLLLENFFDFLDVGFFNLLKTGTLLFSRVFEFVQLHLSLLKPEGEVLDFLFEISVLLLQVLNLLFLFSL